MKQPPENWEDIKELYDHCTCNEYEWEEQICEYSEIWQDSDTEDYCNCCPYCSQECSYNV